MRTKIFAFSLLALCSLPGCPLPCYPSEALHVDEMDPNVVGIWSGKTISPGGGETYCDFTFRQDGTFLLEFYLGAGQVGTIAGEWATQAFERFDPRLDLAIGCTNFTDLQQETYRIWNYEIVGERMTAGKPQDFMLGPDDPNRTGAFYDLIRAE